MTLTCPSDAVDVNVNVNEFSHRLICTSWSGAVRRRLRGYGPLARPPHPARVGEEARRRPGQLLVRKHTANSLRQRPRSRRRPRPYRLFPYGALVRELTRQYQGQREGGSLLSLPRLLCENGLQAREDSLDLRRKALPVVLREL